MAVREQWPALDGLRGISIVLVVFVHTWAHAVAAGTGLPILLRIGDHDIDCTWIFATGHNAVQTFFVLSGFLLYSHWLETENNGFGRKTSTFFGHRIRRIIPAFSAAMLIYISLVFLVGHYHAAVPATFSNITINALFLSPAAYFLANAPNVFIEIVPGTWSLNPEVYFYIVMPFLAALCRKVPGKPVLYFALAVLGPIYRHSLPPHSSFGIGFCLPGVMDGFFLGMAAAAVPRGIFGRFRRADMALFPLGAVWYLSLCAHGLLLSNSVFDYRFQLSLSSALMVFGLVVPRGQRWTRWIACPPLLRLGRISYSIFLFNVIVMWYAVIPLKYFININSNYWSFVMNVIVGWPIIYVVSSYSYRMVELPFSKVEGSGPRQRLGQYFKFVISVITVLALPAAAEAFWQRGHLGDYAGLLPRAVAPAVAASTEIAALIDHDRPLSYDVSTGAKGDLAWREGGNVVFDGIAGVEGAKWIALYLPLRSDLLPTLAGRLVEVSGTIDLRGSDYRACLEIYTGDHEVCSEALSAGQSKHVVVQAPFDQPERAQIKISFFPASASVRIEGSLSNIAVTEGR